MSLAQVADLAYVTLADRVEARATADRLLSGLAKVMGSDTEVVDVGAALAEFDEHLEAEPAAAVDSDQAALLRELGVGR